MDLSICVGNFHVRKEIVLTTVNGQFMYIEDIYFFVVNTKYISSSVLKTLEFSRVRSTSENSDVSIHEMKNIW